METFQFSPERTCVNCVFNNGTGTLMLLELTTF